MRLLLWLALAAGAVVTLAGLLVPVMPWLEIANHLRPGVLSGAVLLYLLALAAGGRTVHRAGAALLGINAVLAATPLIWSAATTRGQAQAAVTAAAGGERRLTVMTFNIGVTERPVANIADFILMRRPDIVVMQEVTRRHAAALLPRLAANYPHRHVCIVRQACAQILLSRLPWVEAGEVHRSEAGPEMVWARFEHPGLGKLSVHGLHSAWPFRPELQVRHVDRLIATGRSIQGPAILAGDFNLTPWSYQLQRLLAGTGLRRHGTFLRSWPTDGQFRIPAPVFLIDHVLSTPDIRTVAIEAGPAIGSDHLPIIATLQLPSS